MINKLNSRKFTLVRETQTTRIYAMLIPPGDYVMVQYEFYYQLPKKDHHFYRSIYGGQKYRRFIDEISKPSIRHIQFSRQEFIDIFGQEDCE